MEREGLKEILAGSKTVNFDMNTLQDATADMNVMRPERQIWALLERALFATLRSLQLYLEDKRGQLKYVKQDCEITRFFKKKTGYFSRHSDDVV